MLNALRKRLPMPIRNALRRRQEARALDRLPQAQCDVSQLTRQSPVLADTAGWKEIEPLAGIIEHTAGAVNPGDRRAIYTLTRALKARRVLEVGTNIGGSTVMYALALKGEPGARLVTVDIVDVNGPGGPCARAGVPSPLQAIKKIGCEDLVTFVARDSLQFMRECTEKFDLIFLDGRHDAEQVYQEVPLALRLLNPNGLILLHDYFPGLRPLWENGNVIPGPWMAIERFRREGVPVSGKPLGALPWPTKYGSSVTSLAYLTRA